MASDIAETVTKVVPHMGGTLIYFTATKTAQSDTITFGDYRQVLWASAFVGTAPDTVNLNGSTINLITLTSATTGAIKGIALVIV